MQTDRSKLCGCKGIRTCLTCEKIYGLQNNQFQSEEKEEKAYVYCPSCEKCWPGWDMDSFKSHPTHLGEPLHLEGIYVQLDFISEEEENALIRTLDKTPWDASQSGRRKQNYGPKCNFKKRKLRLGDFKGYPEHTRFLQDRFSSVELLKDYKTVEQCSLEYNPERGASIDPHIDDCWVWGERIVTVSLMTDSVLTLRPCICQKQRYNRDLAPVSYLAKDVNNQNAIVRIPMPRRSLTLLYGEARYNWEHSILREDIIKRRVCLTYREFTAPFLPGGVFENEGKEILDKATLFF